MRSAALVALAITLVLFYLIFVHAYWQLSALIASDNADNQRQLLLDVPILLVTTAAAAAAVFALGRSAIRHLATLIPVRESTA